MAPTRQSAQRPPLPPTSPSRSQKQMPFLIDGCQSVQSYSDFKELSKQLAVEPSNHHTKSTLPRSPEPRHSAKESLERDRERRQRESFDVLDRLCKHRPTPRPSHHNSSRIPCLS